MGDRPVLGNDPFRRGAASRAEPEPSAQKKAGADEARAPVSKTAGGEAPEKRQTAAKKTAAKKTAAKQTAAKKTAAKKTAAKKTAAKKTAAKKTAAKKTAAEKTAAEKTAAEKTAAEKTAAKKTAAKKTAAKKTAAKQTAAKQTAAKASDRPEPATALPEAAQPNQGALDAPPEPTEAMPAPAAPLEEAREAAREAPEVVRKGSEASRTPPEGLAEPPPRSREGGTEVSRTPPEGLAEPPPRSREGGTEASRPRGAGSLEQAFEEARDASQRLGEAVRAAGMGGAAALELGEEVARAVGGVESALRRVLGTHLAEEVQEAVGRGLDTVRRLAVGSSARRAVRGGPEIDEFGLDPSFEARVRPLFEYLFHSYFRVETRGVQNVPGTGRCLLVCNHSGALPWDGPMVKSAIALRHGRPRQVRPLVEDYVFHAPFLGSFLNRYGAVRACPENAERLLAHDALVAVFPEGIQGLGKLYRERHRLQRFGRGGFVKLALRTGTPLVPVSIVGAEESYPILFKVTWLVRSFGVPYLPITPTFPLLGPLGLLPLPSKWTIEFGEPLDLSAYGPEAADDRVLVSRLAEQVRSRIQGRVDALVSERKNPITG